MLYLIKKTLYIFILSISLFIGDSFAVTTNFTPGEIGDYGSWTTETNRNTIIKNVSDDMEKFIGTQNQQIANDYVPIEAKLGIAFINGLSIVSEILDNSLVRFAIIFMVLMFIYWLGFETYKVITDGTGNMMGLAETAVKKAIVLAIWIIALTIGIREIFALILVPIVTISTYLSDLILNAVSGVAGLSLPDTCDAIHKFTLEHASKRMVIAPDSAADIMCIPTRLSGFFYTAIFAGWKWMLAGIGRSTFTFIGGAIMVALFTYNAFKFIFIAFGVIADLFMVIIMLPFTAIAENTAKTSYTGIAGTIFNGFLGVFKTQKLASQITKFISSAIYFVSLSIVIAVCTGLLSGAVTMDMTSEVPSLDNNGFITTILTGALVAYLASQAETLAGSIGGAIDYSFGKDFQKQVKTLWDNLQKTTDKIIKAFKSS